MTNLALILGAIFGALAILNPRALRSREWRATVTPLASIIGSGFLVAGPILVHVAGRWAWAAMAGLCAAGFLFGEVMRHNIRHIEPRLARLDRIESMIEQASKLLLALSYFISVAYYLSLFAAFALRIVGLEDAKAIREAASIAIFAVGLVGFSGGLKALERIEVVTVGIKLSVIAGLLLALSLAFGARLADLALAVPAPGAPTGDALRIVLGLVILVQGFETSRFLDREYDGDMRVRTMRRAQLLSTAIYVLFVTMVSFLFPATLSGTGAETEVIDMLAPLGAACTPLLIGAALASQSSAAIADTNGAGGLIREGTRGRLSVKWGNLLTAAAALAIVWSANIFQIIAWASRAFVAYYALQSIQAARASWRRGSRGQALLYVAAMGLAVVVLVWAAPAAV